MMAAETISAQRLRTLLHDRLNVPVEADRHLAGLTLDSRRVEAGFAFVALPSTRRHGTRGHGLDFLDDALERGAAAVLVDAADPRADAAARSAAMRRGVPMLAVPDLARALGAIAARFHSEPSSALARVYAVTGTDGKTSVTHFLAAMRDRPDHPAAMLGTLGQGRIGATVAAGLTTPDAISVQAALADLVGRGCREVALEASSHGLDQHRLEGTRIDVAVLTQLGRDHLDYHTDIDDYAAAKARLFDWPGLAGVALNLDDAFGRELMARVRPQIRRIGYGRGEIADAPDGTLRALDVAPRADGIDFRLRWRGRDHAVALPLLGLFNVDNVLAAAAALLAGGERFIDVVVALNAIRPVPGRMERFGPASGPGIVVDYAHNAGALTAALAAVRAHTPGRVWCVFGAGGDRDPGKRPLMATAAAAGADHVVVTDDNPRSEDPAAIVADIVAGMPADTRYQVEHDRGKALSLAWQQACPGDAILLAGKGHETTQTRAGEVLFWSDREAAAALAGPAAGGAP